MGKAFLFTGGGAPTPLLPEGLPGKDDLVIAADSGLEYALRCDISPDLVIGDFDSLSDPELLNGLTGTIVESHGINKDHTDTELALERALQAGFQDIIILGGGGGRMDHFLAILALFERPDPPRRWYGSFGRVVLIDGPHQCNVGAGGIVSFFPLGREPCKPWSRGLKWELEGLTWKRGDAGVSNRQEKNSFQVDVLAGTMVMVVPMDQSEEL